MKSELARIATHIEAAIEAVLNGRDPGSAGIEPYTGYSTPDSIIVRGRVLALREQSDPVRTGSRWQNFRDMAALFNTKEMRHVRVQAANEQTITDDEGYFTLKLPRSGAHGWINIDVTLPDHDITSACPVRVTSPDAQRGIISDIDDTLILTEAWSLRRNLWNSMTGNASSRHVFPDAVKLMRRLHARINPVFYVSSSPWNLHAFLEEMFSHNGLLRGPKFLRDLGIGQEQLITPLGGHHGHKGDAIDTILAAEPHLPFILMGDTGQHDAQVYHHVIERHGSAAEGGRIERVILRAAEPVLGEDDHSAIAALNATTVPIDVVRDYDELSLI